MPAQPAAAPTDATTTTAAGVPATSIHHDRGYYLGSNATPGNEAMSYDLAVFDPRDDLRDPTAFSKWYRARTSWEGEVHFDEAPNSTASLQAWLQEMLELFPPMNGTRRPSFEDAERWDRAADYAIAPDLIYVSFSSAKAGFVYDTVYRLAAKYGVGFYNVSDSQGEVWFPRPEGGLESLFALSGTQT